MNIRNFAIIAHIDHGKSTLADRIMEICGAVGKDHRQQLLDSLELEREHGITIKLKAIRLNYTFNSQLYTFNLLDTPGHVDFSYEVSRSLASVEGAVLVVDATQGVQAQTLSNFHLALESNLILIPVINKIDSPQAKIEETEKELTSLGFKGNEIVKVSAKTGEGVENLINAIIARIPSPSDLTSQLSALIFDSALDPYKGVVATVRLFGGKLKAGDEILLIAGGTKSTVLQIGYLTPAPKYVQNLESGEVGFVVTSLKDLSSVKVGDTIVHPNEPVVSLPGYRQAKPVIFLSFFPTDTKDFSKLKEALERLRLNDSSISWASESSLSLGQGLRVGFLGLLHAQITQERLEREYGLDIIVTSPSVNFIIDGKIINKPSEFSPSPQSQIKEPYAKITIFAPQKYFGQINELVYSKRGTIENSESIGSSQKIEAVIPLLEILIGYYDDLKSKTSGYASFDFEILDYRPAKLVKLDILVNYEPVEGLSQVIPTEKADEFGRKLVAKLKEEIPRQNIPIPIQIG